MVIYVLFDTPTPRRRAPSRRRLLRLSGPETRFSEFYGPPRHSNALPRHSNTSPRRTSPPRLSEAFPRRTYKLCFCSSLPISLTIVHWIYENPNK